MPRRLLAFTAVFALLLATAACGDDTDTASDEADGATGELAGVSVEGEVGESLEVTLKEPIKSDGAEAAVLTEGDGNTLKTNDVALIQLYVGNGTTGKSAANTYDAGPPVQVTASEGQLFQVILDEVVGQPAGSRVAITVPAGDVWGEQGAAQLEIGGEDTAVFVADIISVQPQDVLDGPQGTEVEPEASAPQVIEEDGKVTGLDWSDASKKSPTELTVIPLVEGDGPEARPESMVTFNYLGAVWGEDKPFDESYSREPVPFGVGINGLIPAWDKTIPGLTQGSRVLIIAPPEDAYGDQEQENIPANSTLAFVVDVLGVDE